nr:E1 [Columba livia papillomavirus 1]
MEFLDREAVDVDAQEEEQSEEEEEEETDVENDSDPDKDTGIGTFTQDGTDTLDSPDCAGHRQLLNEILLQDCQIGSAGVGQTVYCKRPRGESPAGVHDPHIRADPISPGLEALQISPVHFPKKVCRALQYGGPGSVSPRTEEVHSETETGLLDEEQSSTPSTSGFQRRGDAPCRSALSEARGVHAQKRTVGRLQGGRPNRPAADLHPDISPPAASVREGKENQQTQEKGTTKGEELLQRCLRAKNQQRTVLAVFKELYTASYPEVTRQFKSDRTQSFEWVLVLLGAAQVAYEALLECLKGITEYVLYDIICEQRIGLYFCGFNRSKNREGLRRWLKSTLNMDPACLILSDPPNTRSVLAALFLSKLGVGHGELPCWCRDILCSGTLSGEGFELSRMVQWALDNCYFDEASIAYNYAKHAEEDENAKLWLQSNQQAKYVRDACTMVRHYNRGRLHATPINEHLALCMQKYADLDNEDGWKKIVVLLRYQHCVFSDFLLMLREWLSRRPKKSTICFVGVPDSGKTMICMSLIEFMNGRVLSFANRQSSFWLQPLVDCKVAAIDDVTLPCWDYIDTYMRNALDGNMICIDCKHKAPVQMRCPPLLLSSNYDPREVEGYGGGGCRYQYLLSRIRFVLFNRPIPVLNDGQPRFLVVPGDWRSFFLKFQGDLGIDFEGLDYGECTDGSCPPSPAGEGGRAT